MDLPPDRASQRTRPSTNQFHSQDLIEPETNTSQHNSILSHQSILVPIEHTSEDRGREVQYSEVYPLLLEEIGQLDHNGQMNGNRIVRVQSAPNQNNERREGISEEPVLEEHNERLLQSSGKGSFNNKGSNVAVNNTDRHESQMSGCNGRGKDSEGISESQKISKYMPSQAETNLLDFGFTISQRQEIEGQDRNVRDFNSNKNIKECENQVMEIESESKGHFGENENNPTLQKEDNLLDFGFTQEIQPYIPRKQFMLKASQHITSNEGSEKIQDILMDIQSFPKSEQKNDRQVIKRQTIQKMDIIEPYQQNNGNPQKNNIVPAQYQQINQNLKPSVHDSRQHPQNNENTTQYLNSQNESLNQQLYQKNNKNQFQNNFAMEQQKQQKYNQMKFVPIQIQSISEIRSREGSNKDTSLLSNPNQNIFNNGLCQESKEICSNINTSELLNFDSQREEKVEQIGIKAVNQNSYLNEQIKSNSNSISHANSLPSGSSSRYKVEIIGCDDQLLNSVIKDNDIYGLGGQHEDHVYNNQNLNEDRAILAGYYDAEEGPVQSAIEQKKSGEQKDYNKQTGSFKNLQSEEHRQTQSYNDKYKEKQQIQNDAVHQDNVLKQSGNINNVQWEEPNQENNIENRQQCNDSHRNENRQNISLVQESKQTECQITHCEREGEETLQNSKHQQLKEDINRLLGNDWSLMQVVSDLEYLRTAEIDSDQQKYNMFVQLINTHINLVGLQHLTYVGQIILADGKFAQNLVQLLVLRESIPNQRQKLRKFLVLSLQKKIKNNEKEFNDYAERVWNLRVHSAFSQNVKPQNPQKLQIQQKKENSLGYQLQLSNDEFYSHANDSLAVHDGSEYEGERPIKETEIKVNIVQPRTQMPVKRSVLIQNQGMVLRSGKQTKKLDRSNNRSVKQTRKRAYKIHEGEKSISKNLYKKQLKKLDQNYCQPNINYGSGQTFMIFQKLGRKSIVQKRVSLRINPISSINKKNRGGQLNEKRGNSSGERVNVDKSIQTQGSHHLKERSPTSKKKVEIAENKNSSKQKQKIRSQGEKNQIIFEKNNSNQAKDLVFESVRKENSKQTMRKSDEDRLTKSAKHGSKRKSVSRIQNLEYLKQHFKELDIDHDQLMKIQFTLLTDQDRQIADWLANQGEIDREVDEVQRSEYSHPYENINNEEVTVTNNQKNVHKNTYSQQAQKMKIVVQRVIDPDINNHGLYALLKVNNTYFGSIYFLTVISDIRFAKPKTIDEDIKTIKDMVEQSERDNIGILGLNDNLLNIINKQKERRKEVPQN